MRPTPHITRAGARSAKGTKAAEQVWRRVDVFLREIGPHTFVALHEIVSLLLLFFVVLTPGHI